MLASSKWDALSNFTRLAHHAPDDFNEADAADKVKEMLGKYAEALETKGFKVERREKALSVHPKEKQEKPSEQSEEPSEAEPEPPFPGAKPVHHEVTHELVGWLGPDRWVSVD
jgi:hypothetical protein